jgi:two-component system sensor kinase FixL
MLAEPDSAFEVTDELLQVLIGSSVDGLLVLDAQGLIRVFNPACARLFGYVAEEVIGKNVMMLMPLAELSDHDEHLAAPTAIIQGPIIGSGREAVGKHKDQSTFPMYVSVGGGEIGGQKIFIAIVHDLTNRKLDDAIREREKRLNSILDTLPDAVVTIDDLGIIRSFSKAATALFGYQPGEVVGKEMKVLMPSAYRGRRAKAHATEVKPDDLVAVEKGRVVIGQRSDGSRFPMEIAIGEIQGGSKRLFTGFLRDLTNRQGAEQRIVDLQAELLHVSRLSTMGQMTAAIAHELNQPLTAVANYVMAAKRVLTSVDTNPRIERALALLDKAAAQTLRAGSIIKNLRDFVEKRARNRKAEDLGRVVEEAVAFAFVGSAEKSVRVELDLDDALEPVMIDKVQIQQVLINLIRNSIEAMQTADKRELLIITSMGETGFAEVTVQDTGTGMPSRVSARLFQPFVTSKETGMGIGLTICQSIIEAHGGRIWLLDSDPTGTGFRFQLPLCVMEAKVT